MTRIALPNRRIAMTTDASWQGIPITVTIGLHPDTGQPLEVFADHAKGGQIAGALADACVVISLSLQHGITPAALAKSLAKIPFWQIGASGEMEMVDAPASPIGTILEAIMEASA